MGRSAEVCFLKNTFRPKGTLSFVGRILVFASLIFLTACSVGPNYQRASIETPATFSEENLFREATPNDAIAKGNWWELFNDQNLNALQQTVAANNQDLKAAVARVDQARAISRAAKADFYPQIDTAPNGSFFRDSEQIIRRPNNSNVELPVNLNYEADIWGKVRRSVQAAKAEVQATVADYENVKLFLHADVAQNYFNLRATDAEIALLNDTINLRKEALQLIRDRFEGGASSDLDVARAEAELAATESEIALLQKGRAELEHALAVLAGKTMDSFRVAANPLKELPPSIPVGLPSDLLERRPDVAEAERRMAAANEKIGVAKAAFFPTLKLTGAAGLESFDLGTVFNWPSRFWSIGPSITLPIFEGGRNSANLKRSEAVYVEEVALYRQQVLVAFKEVEDGLSGIRFLNQQDKALQRQIAASQRSYDLAAIRYKEGAATYLETIDAQRSSLQSRRGAVQNLSQRYLASVLLVKALGGGWEESIPNIQGSKISSNP